MSVQVANTGTRDGEEVVQLYLRDIAARITRPIRQLKAFRKIALKVGGKQRVEFVLTPTDMSFLDEKWQPTVEAGEFEVFVGNSCEADLSAKFLVETSALVESETTRTPETTDKPVATTSIVATTKSSGDRSVGTAVATLPVLWLLFITSTSFRFSR